MIRRIIKNSRRAVQAAAALTVLLAGGQALAAEVSSPDGIYIGTNAKGLHLYQGIPYAKPPVGKLRWAAPEPIDKMTTPFRADKSGNECVQLATFWRPGKPASWTEDCLNLTVYTPATGGSDLPVMVGFHGGGWVNGSKTDWDPKELARAGYVAVTVNYRLGALGYLALPEFDSESRDKQSSGNYGDLDKIEALRWIHKNIKAFGGNPDQVTIGGQSAGAGSVCWILASPAAKELIQGAVIESIRDCANIPKSDALASGESFIKTIGCADDKDRAACLRSRSPAEILDAQKASSATWRPTSGGWAQPQPALEAYRSGNFIRIPVIFGNNRHETRAFTYEANDLTNQPVTKEDYEGYVRKTYSGRADDVLKTYASVEARSPGEAMANVSTDAGWACPTTGVVQALSKWVPTYVYEFRDETAPIRPYMTVPASFEIGSAHSSELPFVWGSDVMTPLTSKQQKLSKLMTGYWTSLASKKGIPGSGLPTWPAYGAQSPQRLLFLPGGETSLISEEQYQRDHHCGLFTPHG
ncbi:carboxylesterase/lipase family protein [Rhizobium sp. AP16]|uniref:carboxylesterase/lipase family protein n=1 Tax=Rhizobium sp. AP16 TaxID=1144306 RepID=UPI00026ED8A7|nr:carboxylesterase family protein [Rhizobium sp. AP16]EJK79060.1 carboxylesterase type B [Rhizobium sp. AP16]